MFREQVLAFSARGSNRCRGSARFLVDRPEDFELGGRKNPPLHVCRNKGCRCWVMAALACILRASANNLVGLCPFGITSRDPEPSAQHECWIRK
jgi:hypothetical protein